MHEKEFSRRTFLKGGGALIVGFSLAGAGLAGRAQAGDSLNPYGSDLIDGYQVDSWITINADNTATIKSGAILQGTGSDTGVLMIAGEELDMDMSQLKFVIADTALTPNSDKHSASNTIKNAGSGVRAAAAAAKQALLGLAATRLGVLASQLSVDKGVVSGGGKSVSYGELLGGKLFNVTMPASWNMNPTGGPDGTFDAMTFLGQEPGRPGHALWAGWAPAKPISQYKLVGTSPPRIDIPDIVTASYIFIQNIRLPGMLHGRVVRPRGQAVYGFGAPIISVDESSIKHLPNVQIVRKNDFLGVVAPQEYDAIQAAAQLKVKWADPPAVLPGHGNEFAGLRALDSAGKSVTISNPVWGKLGNLNAAEIGSKRGDVDAALASAAHVVSGEYGFHTLAHAPIGPMCAVASVTAQGARIFSGDQGPYQGRPLIASALGLPENRVRVTSVAMGGGFGDGAQYYDVAIEAALMSQAVGAPVRVQLMRWDEIGWTHTGPPALMDVRAGIDSQGNLVAMDFTNTIPGGATTPWPSMLTGVPAVSGRGSAYAPFPMYNLPNTRWTVKSIQTSGNWISNGALRGVGSHPVNFSGEQVIDELAHVMKMDPVAFRIQNVVQGNNWQKAQTHDQLLAVLNAVTTAANWKPHVSASNLSDANVVTGRGVAWSNVHRPESCPQTAAICDVEVNKKTGKVTVKHVYEALSPGLAVYPGGIANQISGGVIMGVSWVLSEQMRYSRTHVTSSDFVSYPILRFKDAPKVTPIVVQWGGKDSSAPGYGSGVGEMVTELIPAVIANAFFDATGVRMRTTPLTPARVRAALKAAGVA